MLILLEIGLTDILLWNLTPLHPLPSTHACKHTALKHDKALLLLWLQYNLI